MAVLTRKHADGVKLRTDNKWRNFLYGYELPKKWRKHFDWMNDEEFETMNFVKTPGKNKWYYALDEFMITSNMAMFPGVWDGYHSDTYFSGHVIRVSTDGEQYKIGYFYS